jgi:hypothetical protein
VPLINLTRKKPEIPIERSIRVIENKNEIEKRVNEE